MRGAGQNRSTAVMARRLEPHDSLDFFPTPPWATRALCQHLIGPMASDQVWDPACGDGAMLRPLREYARAAIGSDVHDYGIGAPVHDFLQPFVPDGTGTVDWIVTNPPFRLAEQFVGRALEVAALGCAMLVRSAFLESVGRYEALFRDRAPAIVGQFTERVPMVKGRLDRNATTATAYAWLVWFKSAGRRGTWLTWIPPCRTRLERDDDYPATLASSGPAAALAPSGAAGALL